MSSHGINRLRGLVRTAAVLAGVLTAAGTAVASDPEDIGYDTVLAREIAPIGDIDKFLFDGKAGDTVTARFLPAYNCGFDARMQLIAPNDSVVLTGSKLNCDSRVVFENYVLTKTGKYTVVVQENEGDSTNSYRLTLQCRGPVLAESRPIGYDTVVADAISRIVEADAYHFTGKLGDVVTLRLLPAYNCGFDARMQLIAPNDSVVLTGSNLNCDSRVVFENYALTQTGKYTVVVQENEGDSTNSYRLTIQCRQRVLAESRLIGLDTVVADAISRIVEADAFHFGGTSGDVVTLRLLPAYNCGFDARMQLIAPNDSVVLTGSNLNCDSRVVFENYALTQTGKYTVVVQENEGDSINSYNLTGNANFLMLDAIVSSIVSPDSVIVVGNNIPVTAVVRNNGKSDDTITAFCRIGTSFYDSVKFVVATKDKDTAIFKSWTPDSVGSFAVVCSAYVKGENYLKNNVKRMTIRVAPQPPPPPPDPTGVASGVAAKWLPADFGISVRRVAASGSLLVRYAVPPFSQTDAHAARDVLVELLDFRGRIVKTLVNGSVQPGWHEVALGGGGTGPYLCRMEAEGFSRTLTLTLAR